jgi:alkylation response protein AidB-like acyl-CoA dehydrogenase
MRFHLTEEQVAIQDAVRGTLAETWSLERLHRFADAPEDFDRTSWEALMALGIGGLALPEDQGGAGLGLLDAALVCEVAGAAAAPGPVIGQILTAIAVAESDDLAARARLADIASGEAVSTIALDGGWVQSARAAALFLADDGDGGLRLVEAGEGVSIDPAQATDRSRKVSRVAFGARARTFLLSAGNAPLARRIRDAALVLIAADALGGAQRVTDMSVAYAKEREQFGQPIGRFQGLKHQLAQMALEVEPARALVWYAAYAWDAGLPDASRAASIAKAHLCEVYTRATRAAIAAHGGIGYTWEYGLHYWFRRSVYDRAWLGSPAEHRARAAELADW